MAEDKSWVKGSRKDRTNLDDAQKRRIIAMYQAGFTIEECRARFKTGTQTISKILKDAGVEIRTKVTLR